VPVRHIEEQRNVPCSSPTSRAGGRAVSRAVGGNIAAIPAALVARAVQITGRYPGVHGSPVHIGDPVDIGIRDLAGRISAMR